MTTREEDLVFLLSSIAPNEDAVNTLLADPSDINWQEVWKTAIALRSAPVVYRNLKHIGLWDTIAIQGAERFGDTLPRVAQDNVIKLERFKSIARDLNTLGIVPMPLKGVAFSILETYPHMGLRPSSDIDFLLDMKDVARASDLFTRRGFTVVERAHGRFGYDVAFSEEGSLIELHYRLFYWIFEMVFNRNYTADVLVRSSIVEYEGCRIRVMSQEDLVLYLCLKCAIDEYRTFRYYIDIDAVVRKYGSLIDWGAIYDMADSMHMEKRLTKIFSFLVKKMNTPLPYQNMRLMGKTFDIAYFKGDRNTVPGLVKLLLIDWPGIKGALYIVTYYMAHFLHLKFGWFNDFFSQPVSVRGDRI